MINIDSYELALIKPVMKSIANLGLYRQNKAALRQGILYTVYIKNKNLIKIGFIEGLKDLNSFLHATNLELLDKRIGTKREFELIKITISEASKEHLDSNGNYIYSNEIIKLLDVLDWPIGSSKRSYKKKLVR